MQSEAEGKSKPVGLTNEVIDGAVDHEYREWVEPEPPSVGILKSSSYVNGDESEAEQVRTTTDDSKQQGRKKGKRAGRKPVWRLVSRILKYFTNTLFILILIV